MDGHALAARDVADDGLAHDGVAALRAVDEEVARALDRDALLADAEQALDRVRDRGRLLGGRWRLQLVRGQEAREHLAHRDLAVPDGGVEVVELRADPELLGQRLRLLRLHLARGEVVALELPLEVLLADLDRLLLLRRVEVVADLRARLVGDGQGQPVPARVVAGGGEDLDDVAVLQAITQGVPGHSQTLGCMGDVPACFVEHLVDARQLGLFHGVLERFLPGAACVLIARPRFESPGRRDRQDAGPGRQG